MRWAVLDNTTLKDARFADVIVSNAVWEPRDEPEVKTMGSVQGLKSLKLSARSDPGSMTRLVGSLREVGLEDRAKEAAHAREIALIKMDFERWQSDRDAFSAILGGFRWAAGVLTNYGLSLGRGLTILIGATLLFVPVYFIWGFSPAHDRRTGLVVTIPAGMNWQVVVCWTKGPSPFATHKSPAPRSKASFPTDDLLPGHLVDLGKGWCSRPHRVGAQNPPTRLQVAGIRRNRP